VIKLWSVRLQVDSPNAKSLASSLVSEEELEINDTSFTFTLNESRAKDARAMWNTRLRSLVISAKVIEVMDS
tara:strand:+ start:384 stop:599 length:216 start_codon:yes stop_codon:yes gene_type:complete